MWQAFVPVPLFQIGAFNTNFLNNLDVRWVGLLAVSVFLVSCSALRQKNVLLLYLAGTLALQGFAYLKFIGYNRRAGHYFLFWLGCVWLDSPTGTCTPWRRYLIRLALLVQLIPGLAMAVLDWQVPFSASLHAANVLRQRGLENLPLAGLPGSIISPIGVYLDRPVYSAERNRWETFAEWDNQRRHQLPSRRHRRGCGQSGAGGQ